jgi:DNA modification methylase
MQKNLLYYGDNLDILRRKVRDETVDLCYIDPPFNSKRNYNQIYNNIGSEDRAQAQAFTDTWIWDGLAIAGFQEILANADGRFQPRLVELMKGLRGVLQEGPLLAYLVSMSLRVTEIHRVLKSTGSFFLHCDPTSSHYLKVMVDAIFSGNFRNEIVWHYTGRRMVSRKALNSKHDTILFYTKSRADAIVEYPTEPWTRDEYVKMKKQEVHTDEEGKEWIWGHAGKGKSHHYRIYLSEVTESGRPVDDVWDIPRINTSSKERLGYPTQKPEILLERIIKACSKPGDVVLDAYCGCGTTVAVAQRLDRRWIGMDITYQSIALILRRLESAFGPEALKSVTTDGIPRDTASAQALAHKKDDRLRKEFEKWAVLTYTNNRAVINEKKGADAGIDALAFFQTGAKDNAKIIFQVKSGGVKRGDIATLRGDMGREEAALAVFITLEPPSAPMIREAKAAGQYSHDLMGRSYDRISIVTVNEIVEESKRLEIPMSLEVLAAAQRAADSEQMGLI